MFSQTASFTRYLQAHAVDIAQPDAAVLSGPEACLHVDQIAMACKKTTVMHGWAGPVAQMQNIHAALAMGSCDLVEYCTLRHPLLTEAMTPLWRFKNGRLDAPQTPGMGLTLDEAFLQRHPFRDTSCLIA